MLQDLRTDLRKDIESMLQRHPGGLKAQEIAERTGADLTIVRSIIGRLRDRLLIHADKVGKSVTLYRWAKEKPVTAQPNRISVMDGIYRPERDNPTSPRRPGHDQHENCGSRMGNTIYFRDGRIQKV